MRRPSTVFAEPAADGVAAAGDAVEGAAAAVVDVGVCAFGVFGALPAASVGATEGTAQAEAAADGDGTGSLGGAEAVAARVADGGDSTCVSGSGADDDDALGSI